MNFTVPTVLKSLSTAGTAIRELSAWRRRVKGDVRMLIGELKDNLSYLDMVIEDDIELTTVLDKISTNEFKRLSKDGFDFNALKREKIKQDPSLKGSELSTWVNKDTEALVFSIYDKLNELKIRYPLVSHKTNYRWNVRINNIRKRIWLLLVHVNAEK